MKVNVKIFCLTLKYILNEHIKKEIPRRNALTNKFAIQYQLKFSFREHTEHLQNSHVI